MRHWWMEGMTTTITTTMARDGVVKNTEIDFL